jgi:hypothetical protein
VRAERLLPPSPCPALARSPLPSRRARPCGRHRTRSTSTYESGGVTPQPRGEERTGGDDPDRRNVKGTGRCPCRCHTSTSSAAASPVRTSPTPARAQGRRGALGSLAEFARLIRELRPRYVVVENVPAPRRLDGDLDEFSETWPRAGMTRNGTAYRLQPLAPLTGETGSGLLPTGGTLVGTESRPGGRDSGRDTAEGVRLMGTGAEGGAGRGEARQMADPSRDAEAGPAPQAGAERERVGESGQPSGAPVADTEGAAIGTGLREGEPRGIGRGRPGDGGGPWNAWATEPDVGRVAHGIPARVDRLAALGNALVPQIAEFIGRRITEWETASGRLATLPD